MTFQLLMYMCKHLMMNSVPVDVVLCAPCTARCHFPESHRKLDAHLQIYLTYNDSCYFWKVTCSNDDRLDMSEMFVCDQNLLIYSAIYSWFIGTYSVMCPLAFILSYVRSYVFSHYFLLPHQIWTINPHIPCTLKKQNLVSYSLIMCFIFHKLNSLIFIDIVWISILYCS